MITPLIATFATFAMFRNKFPVVLDRNKLEKSRVVLTHLLPGREREERRERVNEIETLSLTQIFSRKIPKISFIENFQQQLAAAAEPS